MPASIKDGCPSIVVERAYTIQPPRWGSAPVGATGSLNPMTDCAHGNGSEQLESDAEPYCLHGHGRMTVDDRAAIRVASSQHMTEQK
jgi:hypothetical protein